MFKSLECIEHYFSACLEMLVGKLQSEEICWSMQRNLLVNAEKSDGQCRKNDRPIQRKLLVNAKFPKVFCFLSPLLMLMTSLSLTCFQSKH
ncbi:hypothetical protein BgiMline_017196 [Biomphalaria glabrata]